MSNEDIHPDELAFMQEELTDADVAGTMGRLYLSNPKMQPAIREGSKNPKAAALAIGQTLIETRNKLLSKGYPFSQRIWTAENGVLPEMIETFAHMAKLDGKELDSKFKSETHKEALGILKKFDKAGMQEGDEYPHDEPDEDADDVGGKPDIYMQQPRGALG